MVSVKKVIIAGSSLLALASVGFGVFYSFHSKLFILRKVEVVRSTHAAFLPVLLEDQALLRLASIQVGKVSLFELDIHAIKKSLLAQEWIREVRLQKKFPDTLIMTIILREPKAILQTVQGSLLYVDSTGMVFGSVNFLSVSDLPILTGFLNSVRIKDALQLMARWELSDLNRLSSISSIVWDSEKGYRLLVTYLLAGQATALLGNEGSQFRTMIDLGHEVDESLNGKIFRLTNVIRYLSSKSIAARQIWADAGKKVVVKTGSGS